MKKIVDEVTIYHTENISGEIIAPASKSYAQRSIAIAALANGISQITNMTICNDTLAAIETVKALGAEVTYINETYHIKGGISPKGNIILNIGEAGLSARLFAPIASLFKCKTTITGEGSILSRPLGNIEVPLNILGAKTHSNNGLLPIDIQGAIHGGEVTIDGSSGSQFLTGLLIALPLVNEDSIINVTELRSIPYIDMTIDTMRHFGVDIEHSKYTKFSIRGNQHYSPTTYNIEGDWSGASCILVAGAIAGDAQRGVKINNLKTNSSQADMAILNALKQSGARIETDVDSITIFKSENHSFTFDATHCPDLFPALVALAASANGTTTLIGTRRLINKESNRAKVLYDVYKQMGIEIDISEENIMKVKGGKIKGGITIDSYNDHRIAMSIATASLIADSPITITTAKAVNKSYKTFFEDLRKLQNE